MPTIDVPKYFILGSYCWCEEARACTGRFHGGANSSEATYSLPAKSDGSGRIAPEPDGAQTNCALPPFPLDKQYERERDATGRHEESPIRRPARAPSRSTATPTLPSARH